MFKTYHASVIVNEIYNILDDHETEGLDLYKYFAISAIEDYLTNQVKIDFNLCCSEWPNEEGGVCAVAFIDEGRSQLVMFDYRY